MAAPRRFCPPSHEKEARVTWPAEEAEKGEPEFQVAPMIDVLLVLLIFFMSITSAQVLKVDKSITLPIAANALKMDNSRSQAIVNVRWNEAAKKPTYTMDDKVYADPGELTKALVGVQENRRNQGGQGSQSRLPVRHSSRPGGSCRKRDPRHELRRRRPALPMSRFPR